MIRFDSKFTVYFSFSSIFISSARSVTGGNVQLPRALVNASKADLHLNTKVHTITKSNTEYTIGYTSDGRNESIATADAIVIAAPLEWTGKSQS